MPELEAQQNEDKKGSDQTPEIDPKVIAEKVYRLMQKDLILERERSGK
jgi:hypothetical protein